MTSAHALAAATLVLLGGLHSLLGERMLIGPLLADDRWRVPVPRRAAERLLRFAWHLTSIAWLALALVLLGVDTPGVVAATMLASGLLVLSSLPAHLAWPLFLLGALWAGLAGGHVGDGALQVLAMVGIGLASGAAAMHVLWAAGGGARSMRLVIPTDPDGTTRFRPGPLATLGVAGALTTFAIGLAGLSGLVEAPTTAVRWLVGAGTAILALRAIGDGRYTGFTKRVRSTAFARRDDLAFTPAVVLLAIAGVAALSR